MTSVADQVNDGIDTVYNLSEDAAKNKLLLLALSAIGIPTGGVLAAIVTPIIIKILDKTAFKFLRFLKREQQTEIDIVEGELIIRKVDLAVEQGDEAAYVDAISQY